MSGLCMRILSMDPSVHLHVAPTFILLSVLDAKRSAYTLGLLLGTW